MSSLMAKSDSVNWLRHGRGWDSAEERQREMMCCELHVLSRKTKNKKPKKTCSRLIVRQRPPCLASVFLAFKKM